MKYSFDDLKGRNCVITGGFGILGIALTKGLLEAGVQVAVISRSASNPEKGEELTKEYGVKCLGISASTTDKAALEAEIAKKANDADLAAIAKTGSTDDLVQGSMTLVFDCGTSAV